MKVTIEKVKEAILARQFEENERVFSSIAPLLRDKLRGRSTLYLICGGLMLLDHLRFAPGERFFAEVKRSEAISRILRVLRKNSLIDIFGGMLIGKGFDFGIVRFKLSEEHLGWLREVSSRYRRYMEAIAEYCSENELEPGEVLDDPSKLVHPVRKAWGSVDGFLNYELRLMEGLRGWAGKLEGITQLPLEPIAPMILKAKINRDPKELGLTDEALSELVRSIKAFISDLVLIVDLFIDRKRELLLERLGRLIEEEKRLTASSSSSSPT